MGRGAPTLNCSAAAIQQCSSQMVCPVDATTTFEKSFRGQIWRVDALLLTEAVLAGVIVGIGAYGQRYRHHPITCFIFLGATTLFLPIISSVVSTVGSNPYYTTTWSSSSNNDYELSALVARCDASDHSIYIVCWALLVQIIMINTSTLVSVDDREGQSKGPPFELLVRGVWTFYLGLMQTPYLQINIPIVIPFVLLCSKIVLNYYAFGKARRSFALGRNPGLVFVHMQKLQARESNHVEPPTGEDGAHPPPLLVMREEGKQVEVQPRGYSFKDDSRTTSINSDIDGLVTIDKVWQLESMLLISTPQLKDLCLSFALFKLLRCQFAGYKLTNAGSMGTLIFFRSLLMKAGGQDRVFALIVNELSFLHDYYYSSLPIYYSKCCLPILSIFLSLLTIGYCILFSLLFVDIVFQTQKGILVSYQQLQCTIWCIDLRLVSDKSDTGIGRLFLDLLPLQLLLVLAMAAEVRDIASYICSNWTKVALICRYVNRATSHRSLCMQKCVSLLLRCRCKLMKHWDGKMSQCSVLVFPQRASPLFLVRRLLHLPDRRKKVKMPDILKVSIISALRSSFNGDLRNSVGSLRRSQVGESFIWACLGKGTSDIILIWHIATCILEVKHPNRHNQEQDSPPVSNSHPKISATHLSRYCAYLVTWCPELLPDNIEWSKSLYEDVKKDARRALASHHATVGSSTPEDEYQKLIELLSENSKHEVLKNGVKLGKQLVETVDDEETAWKLLADFWSQMILYVAPSDNLKGHKEAIARGGELITLLWAMLFHAGIVSRPGEEDGAASTSAGTV